MMFDYVNMRVGVIFGGILVFFILIVILIVVVFFVFESKGDFLEGCDFLLWYDVDLIVVYFKKRLMDIVMRFIKIMFECLNLIFNILLDKYFGWEW